MRIVNLGLTSLVVVLLLGFGLLINRSRNSFHDQSELSSATDFAGMKTTTSSAPDSREIVVIEVPSSTNEDKAFVESSDIQTSSISQPSATVHTPVVVEECDSTYLASWKAAYLSKEQYYKVLVDAESNKSKRRLEDSLNDLNRRGMGFSGQVEKAKEDEKALLANNLKLIDASRDTDLFTMQERYPANC